MRLLVFVNFLDLWFRLFWLPEHFLQLFQEALVILAAADLGALGLWGVLLLGGGEWASLSVWDKTQSQSYCLAAISLILPLGFTPFTVPLLRSSMCAYSNNNSLSLAFKCLLNTNPSKHSPTAIIITLGS